MRNNLAKGNIKTVYGSSLPALVLIVITACLSACNNDVAVDGAPTTTSISEPVETQELAAEEGSLPGLRAKLKAEAQELMDMNQRKADLEAEIMQIRQAIGEADRVIEQKELELQTIKSGAHRQTKS